MELNSSPPQILVSEEQASLMDQDLSLMKQLLTLNETIEDLKANRKVSHSKDSLSPNVNTSDWSVSETDMYSPDEEQPVSKLVQSCVPSQLLEQNIEIKLDQPRVEEPKTPDIKNKPIPKSRIPTPQKPLTRTLSSSSQRGSDVKTSIPVYVKLRRVRHKEQDSLDSGYGECGRIHKDIEATI
ncbi:hypothetical protein KUTeg_016980 [Tegillarca granosa]|uniref:Neurotrophin-3 n=1 Tax=Tegillarca granosa TaxID=220873 RepID=A0ABQ9ESR0_TEGGR|nr:hypothetical protein KUTeg_016980 [Tegillarca granosa]